MSLLETGLLSQMEDGISLTVSKNDALRYAAVLRGVAYARYRQRDSNQIEITLSPPAHPSRLMEMLPKQGFSWTRLYHTKDSLIELASQADILTYAISHDPAFRNPATETFHAKILLADDDKAYIGSANMTRWLRDFSMECGVILRGPSVKPVATLVEAMIKIGNPWVEHDNANP